jgi:hypothetical protein
MIGFMVAAVIDPAEKRLWARKRESVILRAVLDKSVINSPFRIGGYYKPAWGTKVTKIVIEFEYSLRNSRI